MPQTTKLNPNIEPENFYQKIIFAAVWWHINKEVRGSYDLVYFFCQSLLHFFWHQLLKRQKRKPQLLLLPSSEKNNLLDLFQYLHRQWQIVKTLENGWDMFLKNCFASCWASSMDMLQTPSVKYSWIHLGSLPFLSTLANLCWITTFGIIICSRCQYESIRSIYRYSDINDSNIWYWLSFDNRSNLVYLDNTENKSKRQH